MCQETNGIPVVFENNDLLLVDKPAGMNFHSEEKAGLVVLLSEQVGQQIYPVHRLDKMTSGLLLFAKNLPAAQALQSMFEKRQLEKFYLAISIHKPKKKQGWIKGDMLHARRGDWKLAKSIENPAITQFFSESIRPKERAFLLKIHTGKTHQVRVAMKSLSAPIAGDLRYEQKALAEQEQRGYLHAYALRFQWQGERLRFVLPPNTGERFLTDEIQASLENWQQPWRLPAFN